MTITVADLVARVRSEGVQETAAAVKAVGESAEVTRRALELMAEAATKQAGAGGNVADWMKIFQQGGVQPTAAALAQARQEMEKTAAAATQTVQPAQAVARAAADTSGGFRLSESSIVRFATALVGVNLGISLVAGAARQIHSEILASVDAARALEQAGRAAAAGYGLGTAQGIGAAAGAFGVDPSTRGTQAQYIQSVAGMRSLTTEYGLSLQQVQQLVTASGQLARIQGVDLPTAAKALDAVMRGNVSAAAELGVTLTDQMGRLRGVGASYQELVTISGRSRAEQVLLRATLQNVQSQQDNVRGSADNLAAAYDRLAKNADLARAAAGRQLAGPGAAVIGGLADILNPPGPTPEEAALRRAGIVGMLSGGRGQLETGEILSAEETQRRLADAQKQAGAAARDHATHEDELARASTRATAAIDAQRSAYEALRIGVTRAVESIARVRLEQGEYGTIGEAAVGPYGALGQAPRAVGAAAAASDELALRAQRIARGQGDRMRQQLQQAVGVAGDIGPNAVARAQQDLANYDARVNLRTRQAEAQTRAAQLDLATAETQAQLERITLTQRERYVQLMRDTVDLRRLDVQQQQIGVQANQELIRAQQAALPAQFATSAARYQQNLAQAISQQRMARLLQGQDVSGLPSLNELINQNVQGQLAEGENAPALVRGARGVEVAGQAVTTASLNQSLTESNIRLAELANDAKNLDDLPRQTALELELVQNNRDQLSVQTELREYLKQLVWIMSSHPPQLVPADRQDRIDAAAAAPPAPSDLAGARR